MHEKNISDIVDEHERTDLYMTIIDALCKQLPYIPKSYPGYAGQCLCDAIFLDKETNYCGNCGQKLNWREKL